MKKYKMVFSDLDGTLLNSKGDLSEENAKAIKKMGERGITFAVATGRALGEIPSEVRYNKDIRYYITSNGTAVYDKADDSLMINGMGREEIDKMLSVLEGMTVIIGLHHKGVAYYHREGFDNYEYFRMNDYYHSELAHCIELVSGDMRKFVASLSEIQCFCIFFRYDEEHDRASDVLKKSGMFNVTASVEHAIEVTKAGVTKGTAIRDFAEAMGVRVEDTIAMGDSKNDTTLLSAAGLGLAVSNAKAELIPYADEVVCSNNEHVAAYVLDKYFD